jgi:hypothetical protein
MAVSQTGNSMDLAFWTQEWPLIRGAPHLVIAGAIAIALAVWALVNWAYHRQIKGLKAQSGAWEARLALAHDREAIVLQKRNELEATVQLLNNQITTNAATDKIAATTQSVTLLARELASANSALSEVLIPAIDPTRVRLPLTSEDGPPDKRH